MLLWQILLNKMISVNNIIDINLTPEVEWDLYTSWQQYNETK